MYEFVEEADIQITRNLKNKAFTTRMSPLERVDLKEICLGALKTIEPIVFSTHIDTEDEYPEILDYSKGKFYAINQKYLDYPNKFPLLKEYGVYSDWPNDRVIYKNKDIVVIINEEEHLKFKVNFNKTDSKEKLTTSLFQLYEMLDQFEKIVPFAYDDKFGYLSSLPSNTGNSIHFQLKVKLNSDIEKQEKIKSNLTTLSRQFNDNLIVSIESSDNSKVLKIINSSANVPFVQIMLELLQNKEFLI